MTFKPLLLLLGLACAPAASAAPKSYTLSSPDGELQGSVTVGSDLRISLEADGRTVLAPSPVSMTLAGGETLGHDPRVVRIRKHSADETIESPFYTKARVSDRYNELTISFRGDYSLVLRLYDDGMAYRSVTQKKERSSSNASRRTSPSPKITRPAHPTSTASSSRISNGSSPTRSRTPTSGSR